MPTLDPTSDRTHRSLMVRVLVDRGSIEIFAADVRVALSEGLLLPRGNKAFTLSIARGKARLVSFDMWTLRSIWSGS